ncbi:hypothetical protein GCM10010321_00240 [Streptomyces chartreusis]|nr:hypothetical protein GCM10010321_00240 [Streptomyces chartreusis]
MPPITPDGSGCLHVGLVVDARGYRVEWLIVAGDVAERSGAGSEICSVHVVVEHCVDLLQLLPRAG